MIGIPSSVQTFSNGNTKVYEQFKDLFNQYKSEACKEGTYSDASEKKLSIEEKEKIVNQGLLKEVKRLSGVNIDKETLSIEAYSTNPSIQWATFAVIGTMIDMIIPDTIIQSTGPYTDVRVGDYGDNFAFDVKPRDLFVVSKHGRARRLTELKKQFVGQVTITPELREISVAASLYRILAGKESLAEFAMKAVRSVETEMSRDIYTTFDTAMDALPDTPVNQQLKATGLVA